MRNDHSAFSILVMIYTSGGQKKKKRKRKKEKKNKFFVILHSTALKSSTKLKVPGKIMPELCGCKFCTTEVDQHLQTFLTSITNDRDKKTDLF